MDVEATSDPQGQSLETFVVTAGFWRPPHPLVRRTGRCPLSPLTEWPLPGAGVLGIQRSEMSQVTRMVKDGGVVTCCNLSDPFSDPFSDQFSDPFLIIHF